MSAVLKSQILISQNKMTEFYKKRAVVIDENLDCSRVILPDKVKDKYVWHPEKEGAESMTLMYKYPAEPERGLEEKVCRFVWVAPGDLTTPFGIQKDKNKDNWSVALGEDKIEEVDDEFVGASENTVSFFKGIRKLEAWFAQEVGVREGKMKSLVATSEKSLDDPTVQKRYLARLGVPSPYNVPKPFKKGEKSEYVPVVTYTHRSTPGVSLDPFESIKLSKNSHAIPTGCFTKFWKSPSGVKLQGKLNDWEFTQTGTDPEATQNDTKKPLVDTSRCRVGFVQEFKPDENLLYNPSKRQRTEEANGAEGAPESEAGEGEEVDVLAGY